MVDIGSPFFIPFFLFDETLTTQHWIVILMGSVNIFHFLEYNLVILHEMDLFMNSVIDSLNCVYI